MTMRFSLDKAKEHMEDGLQAQETGRPGDARYHYLKAADHMTKAAERTENRTIAAKRLEYAKQLRFKAEALEPLIRAAQAHKQPLPVATAEGPYPIPSRTRKSSPPAPMVLHGRLCGRVGRRRLD